MQQTSMNGIQEQAWLGGKGDWLGIVQEIKIRLWYTNRSLFWSGQTAEEVAEYVGNSDTNHSGPKDLERGLVELEMTGRHKTIQHY